MRLIGTLLLGLLILPMPARANPPIASMAYKISETELSLDLHYVALGPGDVLYGLEFDTDNVVRSDDGGASFDTVKVFADGTAWNGLFVDSSSSVLIGRRGLGALAKGAMSGDTLACSRVLTFTCDECPGDCGVMWQACEDDSAYLYVGEYTVGTDGTEECCYVYQSKDGGDNWLEPIYHDDDNARHPHLISWDPYALRLYISQGDGTGEWEVNRSEDYGAAWTAVNLATPANSQPLAAAFLPRGYYDGVGSFESSTYAGAYSGTRFLGSDKSTGGNRITRVRDLYYLPPYDTNQPDTWVVNELILTTADHNDGYVWVMSSTPDTIPIAGTVSACDTCAPAIYIRERESDHTNTRWRILKSFGELDTWGGVSSMTTFGSDGYAYYTVGRTEGAGGTATYKFKVNPYPLTTENKSRADHYRRRGH